MLRCRSIIWRSGALAAALGLPIASADDTPRDPWSRVAAILSERCLECHASLNPSGGLDLSNRDGWERGGDSGPAIIPSDIDSSFLLQRVEAGEMPPEKNGQLQKLPDDEIDRLREWIRSGAYWPLHQQLDPFEISSSKRGGRDWWSLQPIDPPAVPSKATAIDDLLQSSRASFGLSLAPPAPPRQIIRRLYFDLIGLPPSPEQVELFVQNPTLEEYEKIVDQLLDSRHFAERWARYWFDVARFAETNGYERDAVKSHAWKYRDWVIDAIHDDLPFDQFVTHQLAGDEIVERNEHSVIATGFLRLGTWDDEPNDPAEYVYERLEDLVHVTSTAFLGMTVKCARCHDHKFDPISQMDYYRMAACFWPGPVEARQREWNGGPTSEELGFDVLGWTDIQREPPPLFVLIKGDVHRPSAVAKPGSLSFLPETYRDFRDADSEAKTTLRRLQLAEWIVDSKNPLTPRVIVNRLWQHHFGEGLIRTSDNFGFNGDRPIHQSLLDWLAAELHRQQWRLKPIHKLMVMSETYRQSSTHPNFDDQYAGDPSNRYLWHAQRRRLDAESLRDAILSTSGLLDLRVGGPSFRPAISEEALEGLSMKGNAYQPSSEEECRRRSIYIFAKRALTVPFMATFDVCDSAIPTGRREVTTVAPQALSMLNNSWVVQQSQQFAKRVCDGALQDEGRVRLAWRLALNRDPRKSEMQAALNHVQSIQDSDRSEPSELRAWASLCHVLLNTNEFIYVD